MKRIFIFLGCLIVGPMLGYFLSSIWYTGASTLWRPIDYFPHHTKNIIAMKPFGREFWVETKENDIYQITYPCSENQTCWIKVDNIPSDTTDGEVVDYNVSNNRCENNNFVYPLLHKITMCITSASHAPDATYTVSLALTNDDKLWIWDNPWKDPYTILISMAVSIVVGGITGFLLGIFLIWKIQ